MVATNGRIVTVFGGTGFLGRRIARHLRYREFTVRIASRHPDRGHRQFGPDDPQLQFVEANIHDERSVADAMAGAYGVVNAVSLYLERGQETFHSVHVDSAQRVAAQALRSEEHTSELQSLTNLVCRLLLEKKNKYKHDLDVKAN